jgi:hypothetical protein
VEKHKRIPVVYKDGMPSLLKKLKHEKISAVVKQPKLKYLNAFKQDQLVSVSLSADSDKYMFKGVDSDAYNSYPDVIDDSLPSLPDVFNRKQQNVE